MQSWLEQGKKVGFRVHIVPTRGGRPRDNQIKKIEDIQNPSTRSLFQEISSGDSLAIPIACDDEIIGTYTDEPSTYRLSNYSGVCIVNKYSPLNHIEGEAHGVALVSFSNIYSEDLSDIGANVSILKVTHTALNYLFGIKSPGFNSNLLFFNIGPNSGASLRQLHSQTYLLPENSGLITYSCVSAFQSALKVLNSCLVCKMARESQIVDHLGQFLDLVSRTIWEDEYTRVVIPFAPIRAISVRIIPKRHISEFKDTNRGELQSLAMALKFADQSINLGTPSKWPQFKGRTVTFRQSPSSHEDFHFYIDIIPAIPFGGSELVDSLSITTLLPEKTARIIKSKM